MDFEWSSQPLTISSILSRFSLPVLIKPAPGQHGSDRPILLYTIARLSFAIGTILRVSPVSKNGYEFYRPIESEFVAVPLEYPGFFECVLPSRRGDEPIIVPETDLSSIVQEMQNEHRSQAFYLSAPLRVFTLEKGSGENVFRQWEKLEADQVIIFEKLLEIEYTPREDDQLTDDDYEYSWWNCFGKRLINRHETAIECRLENDQICYLSIFPSEEILLLPVGQRGSKNMHKLQTMANLLEQFSLPINLRLASLRRCLAYNDFPGYFQLRSFQSEDFLVCASLKTSNIGIVHPQTPLKFLVSVIPYLSTDETIDAILSRCETFLDTFPLEIHRLRILPAVKMKKDSDQQSNYNSLVHPTAEKTQRTRGKNDLAFTYDTGSDLIEELDNPISDRAILIDHQHPELLEKLSCT